MKLQLHHSAGKRRIGLDPVPPLETSVTKEPKLEAINTFKEKEFTTAVAIQEFQDQNFPIWTKNIEYENVNCASDYAVMDEKEINRILPAVFNYACWQSSMLTIQDIKLIIR